MGNVNTIPVVSQAKSVVQLVTGDVDGAAATQEKFLHECVGVSQVTSLVYLAAGEPEKAGDTQIRCVKNVSNFADGVPGVGHVKGAIHHIAGDHEGGNKAILAATRTTGVMAGGAAGFLVGGPVGAVVGGMATGGTLDGAATLGASLREKEYKPEGIFASVQEVIDNPSGGAIFDAIATPVFDGLAGYQGGKIAGALENAVAAKTAPVDPQAAAKAAEVRVYADRVLNLPKAMAIAEEMRETPGTTDGQLMKQYDVAMALDKKATMIETGGRGPPPAFDPKVTKGPNVYPPGVREDDREEKKFKSNSQQSTSTTTHTTSGTTTQTNTTQSASVSQLPTANASISFYQELYKVITAYKLFDKSENYDLSVIEAKVQRILKGQGVQVVQTQKIFTKVMLNESENQNFKTEQVVSVLYGTDVAEQFDEKNPLKGFQHYAKHPEDRIRMIPNELLLVGYLRTHMNPVNFSVHQFFQVSPTKQQFRVVFNVPTTSGQIRQLSICLSCTQDGSGKAIIYKSPMKDGVECDCYEIITAFLL
ncbi:Protein CBG25024 [Caenorhabditis briggsae]|uniref:Protein CBG25024 n=1 Tax=Caenorhabditis briggsae TaxID=6238 RepID=A8WLZ5_CAEBR|nr:Protein CBG25024 [Caenorhabditis briggsae]CAP21494.1 Protein CBG25024 [Caenorhabditis briggsae]